MTTRDLLDQRGVNAIFVLVATRAGYTVRLAGKLRERRENFRAVTAGSTPVHTLAIRPSGLTRKVLRAEIL